MRTNSIESRTKLLKWIRQKTGASVGGTILVSWNATRIRPDSQTGPVKYPTFKGDMAFLAVDGPNVHVLRLGKLEFHARDSCPCGTPSLEELLAQKPSCTLLDGAQIPTTSHKGKIELDYRRILNINDGEAYADITNYTGIINGCDFVADVTELLNRPGAMTPDNLVAELVNGDKERALRFLDEQGDQEEFVKRCLECIKDLVEAQAGKAHKALRNASTKLRERVTQNLRLEIQSSPKVPPGLVRRLFLTSCCCFVAFGVSLHGFPAPPGIADKIGIMCWWPFLGIVFLIVALTKFNQVTEESVGGGAACAL